jgi:hypothetical protein
MTYINPTLPSGPNVGVTSIIKELPSYIPDDDTEWFLPDQRANMSSILTVDGAYIIDGTLYDYYDPNGNSEITGNLLVTQRLVVGNTSNLIGNVTTSNITVSGTANITGTLARGTYNSGEVIKTIALQGTGFNQGTSTTINSTTYTQIANYVYTPTSSDSRIVIRYSADYNFNGTAPLNPDEWASSVFVDGVSILERRQRTLQGDGATFRTETLFPIEAVYTNSGTAAKTISIRARRIGGDDPLVVNNTGTLLATFIIMEIQN